MVKYITPGTFIGDTVKITQIPIPIPYAVTKNFIKQVYMFMKDRKSSGQTLQEYFDMKNEYISKGYNFDPDLVEAFAERHLYLIRSKWCR